MKSALLQIFCVFASISLPFAQVEVPCPFAEECTCQVTEQGKSTSAVCRVSEIPTFKQSVFTTIYTLELIGNFTEIPPKAFYNLNTTINQLLFERSGVVKDTFTIAPNAFLMPANGKISGLGFLDFRTLVSIPLEIGENEFLEWLQIQRCGLAIIANDSFSKTNLNGLDLNDNNLIEVEIGAFNGIEDKLIYLTLSNNRLSEIPEAIKSLTVVNTVELDGNNITTIPDFAFPNTTTTIELSNNPLDESTFTANTLGGINMLYRLGLESCGLTKVPKILYADTPLRFVLWFLLTNNQITAIDEDSFPKENFNECSFLPDIDDNPIETIDPNAFSAFAEVFDEVSFTNLYNLKSVNFDIFTPMTYINQVSFRSCHKLENISYPDDGQLPFGLNSIVIAYSDRITNLDPKFSIWLDSLSGSKGMNLQNNGFRCDSDLQWMYDETFCTFHPKIQMDGSKCNESNEPLEAFLSKSADINHTCP